MNLRKNIKRILKEKIDNQVVIKEDVSNSLIRVIKRLIPDNTIFNGTYRLPYSEQGNVYVVMSISIDPKSIIRKKGTEGANEYEGIIGVIVNKLEYKSDYDEEFETVRDFSDIRFALISRWERDIFDRIATFISNLDVDFRWVYNGREFREPINPSGQSASFISRRRRDI